MQQSSAKQQCVSPHQFARGDLPSNREIYDLIYTERFGVEYQPIVDLKTLETFAYEALARFDDHNRTVSLLPDRVFHTLHDNPLLLFQVEYKLKHLQLDNSPADYPVFLNLDPDAFAVFNNDGQNHPLVDLLSETRREVVIEIIENSNISNARVSESMACNFHNKNIKLALDDIGAEHSLVPLTILMAVDYMKLDRSWLQRYDCERNRMMLDTLVQYARNSGKKTVLEGVENEQQLQLAQQIGVDYIQGFYFKDRFQTIK
jgi:EAL domain-containing protein (putative c-di-GMP-specific phosphodiesterase class I)